MDLYQIETFRGQDLQKYFACRFNTGLQGAILKEGLDIYCDVCFRRSKDYIFDKDCPLKEDHTYAASERILRISGKKSKLHMYYGTKSIYCRACMRCQIKKVSCSMDIQLFTAWGLLPSWYGPEILTYW